MSIKIKIRKIIIRGVQKIKIMDLEGLNERSLPKKYTDGEHAYLSENRKALFYYSNQKKTVDNNKKSWNGEYIEKGEIFNYNTLLECVKNIKRCGKRLSKINAELKEANKDWHGEELFII